MLIFALLPVFAAVQPPLAVPKMEVPEEKVVEVRVNEIEAVDHLIAATSEKLEQQKQLKKLMDLFREQEERFFQGDQSKEHSLKMVNCARQILDLIKKAHIENLFSSEYIEELALFSSIAGKTTPPRP
jgi:hypothetical protein